jgi:hypothetical protein
MKKYTMRNYLQTKGINLNKTKSWTLKTYEDYDTEDLVIRSWKTEKGELYYAVKQGLIIVKFRGQSGMEDVKTYSDSKISFIVDSVANDVRLQIFVAKWVDELRKENYVGSWTLKKQRKAMKLRKKELRKEKLRSLDKLKKSLEDFNKSLEHSSKCMCIKCKTEKGDLAHRIVTESTYGDDYDFRGRSK